MANPYSNASFFEFFGVFFGRLGAFLSDPFHFSLASDELQMAVLACIAVSGALIGPFLVLRRMTMLANALSHTILLGIVITFLFFPSHDLHDSMPLFLLASVIMGLFTTFLTEFLTSTLGLQADASTGLTFTSLFALGIILVTLLTRNTHIGTEVVMGNVDALQGDDLFWAALIALMNVVLIVLFFKEYLITTFDKGLAAALGFAPVIFSYLLMTQVSITVVSGFRAVGVLMVLALITGPALTARLLSDKLKHILVIASLLGIFGAVFGVALARHLLSVHDFALSTAGVTVCVLAGMFTVVASWKLLPFRLRSKSCP